MAIPSFMILVLVVVGFFALAAIGVGIYIATRDKDEGDD